MNSPLPIDMTYDSSNGTNALAAESISLSFNYDSKKKAASGSAYVRPDVGMQSIYVGYSPATNWGVYCADQAGGSASNSSNNCQFTTAASQNLNYFGQQYSFYPGAQGYVGFSSDIQQGSAATLNLISAPNGDNSPLKQVGLFGLAPGATNDAWKSLFNQYSFSNDNLPSGRTNDFSFSLMYYLYKPAAKWNGQDADTWKYSTFWANGWDESRVDTTKPTVNFKNAATSPSVWALSKVALPGPISGSACLTNTVNSMFILDSQTQAQSLKQYVCQGRNPCTYDTTQMPNITVSITQDGSADLLNITLTPSDYAYADASNIAQISFTQVNPQICGTNTFGFGRLFFAKTLIYFSISGDGSNPTIYLSQMLPFDKISNAERLVLFFFGLAMILAIIGTVVYKATKKEDADGYKEANNA